MQMKKKTIPTLHDDLIVEILSRLPVKSLIRFKRVSKLWYARISSDTFIKRHLTFTSRFQNKLLIHTTRKDLTPKSLISTYCPNPQTLNAMKSEVLHVPYIDTLSEYKVVGSLNGLICMTRRVSGSDYKTVYLWNPAMNHLKVLPPCNELRSLYDSSIHVAFGIDPDTASSYYKVMMFRNPDIERASVKSVYLYTESAAGNSGGRWRCNQNAYLRGWMFISPVGESGYVTVNGVIYWKGTATASQERSDYYIIICFDLSKEVFDVIDLPKVCTSDDIDDSPEWHPMILGESLGLFVHLDREQSIDVWLMSKCNDDVKETWTKKYSVQSLKENMSRFYHCHNCDGNSVAVSEENSSGKRSAYVYIFDAKATQFKKILTTKDSRSCTINSINGYAESLVPLKGRLMTIDSDFVRC